MVFLCGSYFSSCSPLLVPQPSEICLPACVGPWNCFLFTFPLDHGSKIKNNPYFFCAQQNSRKGKGTKLHCTSVYLLQNFTYPFHQYVCLDCLYNVIYRYKYFSLNLEKSCKRDHVIPFFRWGSRVSIEVWVFTDRNFLGSKNHALGSECALAILIYESLFVSITCAFCMIFSALK